MIYSLFDLLLCIDIFGMLLITDFFYHVYNRYYLIAMTNHYSFYHYIVNAIHIINFVSVTFISIVSVIIIMT